MLKVLNDMMLDESFYAVGGLLMVIGYYFIMFVFNAASYALMSIGMYTVAKSRWIRKPWLAWLPLGNLWIMGSISDQYQYVVKGRVKNRRKVLLGLSIVLFVIMAAIYGLMILGALMQMELNVASHYGLLTGLVLLVLGLAAAVVAIITAVIQYIALYDLYMSCDPENAAMFLVLSVVFSVTMPFFVFACRNKELGMPPRKTEQAAEPEAPAAETVSEIPQEEEVRQETSEPEEKE